MSDIIKPENKLSVKNNQLTTYADIISHTFWMETPGRTVLSNKYYFVNQTALQESDENKRRLCIVDIHKRLSNELLFSMKTVCPHLEIVKSADSRKDLMILYDYSSRTSTIMAFTSAGAKMEMKEIPLKINGSNLYTFNDFGYPIQYKNRVYFINKKGELFRLSLDEELIEEYGIDNIKSFTVDIRHNRIICCNTEERRIITIDLETDERKIYENICGSQYHVAPVPAYAPEKLFITLYGKFYYYDIEKAELIAHLSLDDIKHKIPSINKRTLKSDHDGRIYYVQSSKDDRYYAFIFNSSYNYIFAVYDSKSDNIVLDLNMKMENGMPEYIKSSMRRYNFADCAIDMLSEIFEPCALEACERHTGSSPYQISHIEGNVLECRFANPHISDVYHDSIYRIDLEHMSIKSIDLDTEFTDIKRYIAQRMDNCVICEPKEKNGSNTKLILYDLIQKKELDTKTINSSGAGVSLEICSSLGFPCVKMNSTYYIKKDLSLIIAPNRNKKLDVITNAKTILDISEDYILRISESGYKLFIYSRNDGSARYIALRDRCYSASFSQKEGCINVFYFGERTMQRHNFIHLVQTEMPEPEITVPLKEIPYAFRMEKFRESIDGRYIYNIYLPEETKDYKRFMYIYDTEEQKCIYDNVMDYDEENIYRIDAIEENGRFMTLLPDDWIKKLIFVNPYTMELLAKAYFFVEGKFLVKLFTNGKESNYFYTNADEMVKVFSKKPEGTELLLESGDRRRKEYLSLYNSRQKARDRILYPDKFDLEEKAREKLSEYSNNKSMLVSRRLLE
ncbi:MAG: hypothetical protein JXN65_02480 [Clostridia bacterium]|nr:hypothetical protein [Clostridia bacterium]